MILDEVEVTERMESPLNLLNRLRTATNKHKPSNIIPSLPPTADEVINNLENKLEYGTIKTRAARIAIEAMKELEGKLSDVSRPEKLAQIAAEMSKVVNAKNENADRDKIDKPQFVIFAPEFHNENHYETIYARE